MNFLLHSEDKTHLNILKDPVVKNKIRTKLTWEGYLYIEFFDILKELESYIMLKYGDYIKEINHLIPDRSPKMFVDYTPKINDEQKHLLNLAK